VQAGGDADFYRRRGLRVAGELQLGRVGEGGRVALVGPDLADGQPAGDADVVAGFARHAHIHHFRRRRRQLQSLGLGLGLRGSLGRRLLGLLERRRLLLGRGLLGGLLVRRRNRGILRRLRADECRRPQ
jgi:hypothetical protein